MAKDLLYFDGVKARRIKSSALLWDEKTDGAWDYASGGPKAETQDAYSAIPTVFRGVDMIAQAVANMPFVIEKGGEEFDSSRDYQNKLGWLPSPNWLLSIVSKSLDVAGHAYLFPNRNPANYVKSVQYFKPNSLKPKHNKETGELTGFERKTAGKTQKYSVDDIVRFWLADPYVEGSTQGGAIKPPTVWPVKAALRAAGVLGNLDDFIAVYFGRGAVRPMVVTVDGSPQKEETARLREWLTNVMGGVKNAFDWRVFKKGTLEFQQIGDGLDQLRDVELTDQKRQDIALALGIPYLKLFQHEAGGLGGGGVVDNADIEFYQGTVEPRCKFIQEAVNDQLFGPAGYLLRFLPETMDVYQEDENERSSSFARLIDGGVYAYDAFNILGFELGDDALERYADQMENSIQADKLGALNEQDMNMLTEAAGRITRAASLDPKGFRLAAAILGIELPQEALSVLEEMETSEPRTSLETPTEARAVAPIDKDDEDLPSALPQKSIDDDQLRPVLAGWHKWALRRVDKGKTETEIFTPKDYEIPAGLYQSIDAQVKAAKTRDDVNAIFGRVFEQMNGRPPDATGELSAKIKALELVVKQSAWSMYP